MGGEAVYAGFGHRERKGREGDAARCVRGRMIEYQGFGGNEKRRGLSAAAGLGLVFWGNFEPIRFFGVCFEAGTRVMLQNRSFDFAQDDTLYFLVLWFGFVSC